MSALFGALTGAHAHLLSTVDGQPPAIVAAWLRERDRAQLRLVLGGRPVFPPAAGEASPAGRRPLIFPPGAVGADLDPETVSAWLAGFGHWVACVGRADALWTPVEQRRPDVVRRGGFDRYAAHLPVPFAWLVVAEPLPAAQVQPELDQLVNQLLPLARGEVSEAKRIALERAQARHRELTRAQDGGVWRVRLLVGGTEPAGARTAAALLCAAAELEGLPYVLAPGARVTDFDAAMRTGPSLAATTELLAALVRPPSRELAGLRLTQPHSFDVTAEAPTPDGLALGRVLDEADQDVGPVVLSRDGLNRHAFVCGATGAGKSHTVRHLLEQASRAGLPWLAVEPAKAEYARMAGRLAGVAEVVVIRPSDPDRPPAGLNPLEPAPGFPLQTHADLLRALFLASFEAQEPFPQILSSAIQRCYEELGWDLTLGAPVRPGHEPRYPTLGDLQRVASAVVEQIGYGREIAENVQGFIKVRLSSLRLGTTGRFFEGGHPLDIAALRARNVVLEIEDVGDDADKAFFMGVILMRLAEHLRVISRSETGPIPLSHLTVVEEAHRLLRRPAPGATGPAAHAVELFASMLAEVRAYGEGLIIAEQIPGKLIPDVIKNTAVKIVHRLPAQDDREAVGATMNLTEEQSTYLVTLEPGRGAVFADGMDRPLLVRVPDGAVGERRPAAPAPIGGAIGRRSGTCGRDCLAEACTLREMRTAQYALRDSPWLTGWAELAVLAHLTGAPVPVPLPSTLADLAAQELSTRTLDCALSHAVDDAVAVRSTLLQPTVSPAALADHVCAALRGMLAGRGSGCEVDAQHYLARPYRWDAVRTRLVQADPDVRHPASAQWEKQYRRAIPGEDATAQLIAVNAWLEADLADEVAADAVTFGTRRPSTLEDLIGADWAAGVRELLAPYEPCRWPYYHLHRTDTGQE
jgi:DNA helicase HerA-like ATPase